MVMISVYTSIYYNIYMAWALHYIYDCIDGAINTRLPFVGCHTWASECMRQRFDLYERKTSFTDCLDPDIYQKCSGICTIPPGVKNSDCHSYDDYNNRTGYMYWNGIHSKDKNVYHNPKSKDKTNVGEARCYNGDEQVAECEQCA